MSVNLPKESLKLLPECAQRYPMPEGYKFDMKLFESQMKGILQSKQNEVDSMLAYAATHGNTVGLKQVLQPISPCMTLEIF